MISRRITPKRPGRRYLTAFAALGLLGGTLLASGTALAVHELDFQLDGNARATCPPAPDTGFCGPSQKDWADLFNVATGGGTQTVSAVTLPLVTANGTFTNATFTRDFRSGAACALNSSSTTFCTGDTTTFATGSKDTLDMNTGWACNFDHNVNSKIDIMNAYSAAYTRTSDGHKILYFGLEKNKDNGTNDAGFWFLQGNANCDASGGGHPPFTGTHVAGDVLVVAEYSSGGGVGNITAYRWDPTSATNLTQIATAGVGLADCKGHVAGDALCATTNSGARQFNGNISQPWLTSDATLGVGDTVVPPDFFEGGIDLTAAFAGSGTPAPSCFNTFIGDTRSSTSLTATLFDYTRGQLGQCGASLTTQASTNGSVTPGTVVTDTATITGTSSNTPPFPSSNEATGGSNVKFYICELLASGDCTSTAQQVGPAAGQELTATATQGVSTATSAGYDTTGKTPGRYCFYATWAGDSNYTNGASGGAAATECFTIAKLPSTTATTSSPTGDNVAPGTSVTDTATVSGSGPTPTGSVTFFLCQPSEVTAGGCEGTAGTQIGGAVQLVNGSATSAATTNTTTLGKYCWRAVYSGDAVYNGSDHTDATGECFTVRNSASATTAQNWLPNDHIVITTQYTGTVSGTLSVQLVEGTLGATCAGSTGTVRYTETITNPVSVPLTMDTHNSTFLATASGNYYWRVTFTPTSSFATGFAKCETTVLTITN